MEDDASPRKRRRLSEDADTLTNKARIFIVLCGELEILCDDIESLITATPEATPSSQDEHFQATLLEIGDQLATSGVWNLAGRCDVLLGKLDRVLRRTNSKECEADWKDDNNYDDACKHSNKGEDENEDKQEGNILATEDGGVNEGGGVENDGVHSETRTQEKMEAAGDDGLNTGMEEKERNKEYEEQDRHNGNEGGKENEDDECDGVKSGNEEGEVGLDCEVEDEKGNEEFKEDRVHCEDRDGGADGFEDGNEEIAVGTGNEGEVMDEDEGRVEDGDCSGGRENEEYSRSEYSEGVSGEEMDDECDYVQPIPLLSTTCDHCEHCQGMTSLDDHFRQMACYTIFKSINPLNPPHTVALEIEQALYTRYVTGQLHITPSTSKFLYAYSLMQITHLFRHDKNSTLRQYLFGNAFSARDFVDLLACYAPENIDWGFAPSREWQEVNRAKLKELGILEDELERLKELGEVELVSALPDAVFVSSEMLVKKEEDVKLEECVKKELGVGQDIKDEQQIETDMETRNEEVKEKVAGSDEEVNQKVTKGYPEIHIIRDSENIQEIQEIQEIEEPFGEGNRSGQ